MVGTLRDGVETVVIGDIDLIMTTPRARGRGPQATLAQVTGLPLTLAPGESAEFTVRGACSLVQTDEDKKVNLHFRAESGKGDIVDIRAAPGTSPGGDEAHG